MLLNFRQTPVSIKIRFETLNGSSSALRSLVIPTSYLNEYPGHGSLIL